jgi:hypothetical protein
MLYLENMKQGKINKLSKEQKAYIAGFFDADGCVTISKKDSVSKMFLKDYQMVFIIVNTDINIIEWLKNTIGAGCSYIVRKESKYSKWRPCHRYQITGEKARTLLKAILPYSIVKYQRIETVLELPITREKGRSGKRGRTNEEYINQERIYKKLKKQNKRGQ